MSAKALQARALGHLLEAKRLLEQMRGLMDEEDFEGSCAEQALEWSLPDAIGYLAPDLRPIVDNTREVRS
jgi:hypothetical protein